MKSNKKNLPLFIYITMKSCFLSFLAMLFVASTLNAQLVWDGLSSPWTQGTGTETDPYLIETPQNLAWLSDMVNNGVSTYSGVYFKQTEDFDMNGNNYQFNVIGSGIYGYANSVVFSGHYDGNFKSISNLVISDLSAYIALFGYANQATLQGICVRGIRGTGNTNNKNYVGAICGYAYQTTITQCCCIGDVVLLETTSNTSRLDIGGLVGNLHVSELEQCFMKGNVRSERYYTYVSIGGLVGYASAQISVFCRISSCWFVGEVKVTGTTLNNSAPSKMGLLIGAVSGGSNSYSIYQYSISNSYAVGSFVFPSLYQRNDVLVGGWNDTYFTIQSSNNSYSGANLPSTSSYATYRTDAYMKSAAMPLLLNLGVATGPYVFDYDSINEGYPIFEYQQLSQHYTLTVNCNESQGTVTGAGVYTNGTTATLRAMPAEGYLFSGWSDGSTENPRTVTVTGDATYTANFTKNSYNIYIKQDCTVEVE